ncbi:MAG: 4-hydroxy-2-oxovalerate aldolase [Deltaproteobacteria bacterium]|nr:4-hydroxy-2-oxovalerate aldolase [Deltaproteobacteria bacterium]
MTIRDGSYAINYQYTPDQVAQIVGALDTAGVPWIEVGHGCGLGARENLQIPAAASDLEYVTAARNAVQHAKLGVLAGPAPPTRLADIDRVRDQLDFIRVAANADHVRLAAPVVAYCRQRGLDVWFQMMRSVRRTPQQLLEAARTVEGLGASTVYIVDTAGAFEPGPLGDIVALLKAKLALRVGFHGHNNLGLAIANTLAAVEAGADVVDASIRGLGRGAGNTQLETLVVLLQRRGLVPEIHLAPVLRIAEAHAALFAAAATGVGALDLLTAAARIDLYPMPFYARIADALGIELPELITFFGNAVDGVEVGMPTIAAAVRHFGGDVDAVFTKLGIPRPENA